jgi:hypothetical protein
MGRLFCLSTLILLSGMIVSCCNVKNAEIMNSNQKVLVPGPKVIIYQTKDDYSKLVPVSLSEDRKSIDSYPDIKDVYFNGNLAYPTPLHKDYWLDNRGISANVAFLNMTYEEYSKLPKTPTPEELMKMVSYAEPIVSMYSCGSRSSYNDIIKELNSKIDAADFSTCVKIK